MSYSDMKIDSNSKYLKIVSGQPKVIRILTETPVVIYEAFKKKGEPEPEEKDKKQKFLINVFDHDSQKVVIFKFGPAIAKQIKKIAASLEEEENDIMNVDLKIEAEGEMLSKEYTVTPRTKLMPMPPIETLVMHDLRQSSVPF